MTKRIISSTFKRCKYCANRLMLAITLSSSLLPGTVRSNHVHAPDSQFVGSRIHPLFAKPKRTLIVALFSHCIFISKFWKNLPLETEALAAGRYLSVSGEPETICDATHADQPCYSPLFHYHAAL